MKKFWDLKTSFRKTLSLTNRTIAVIEEIEQTTDMSISDIIEELIKDSTIYKEKLEELRYDYKDICDY